jgi:hypothetical protein
MKPNSWIDGICRFQQPCFRAIRATKLEQADVS